jgi:hypothetical protein
LTKEEQARRRHLFGSETLPGYEASVWYGIAAPAMELEKTYRRARALMDEVDANDYEAVCLFESDMEAFCDQYGREPKQPLEWLAWRKDRRREEHGLLLGVMRKQV